jgi:uncharacterized delta-60 repeat protein
MNSKVVSKHALLQCCVGLLAITASAFGQAGQLDPTFGQGGIASQQALITNNSNSYSVGSVAIQSDGKVLVAGGVPGANNFTVPALLRFLSNGNLDKTFGTTGIALLPDNLGGLGFLAIQPDGKIVVATGVNSSNGEVARYTTAGNLDSTFGSGGVVTFSLTAISGLALQPDGRILVSEEPLIINPASEVERLLSDGGVDTSFGTNGFAFPAGGNGALQVLASGEILVYGGLVSRLTSTGAIDTQFGVSGQLLAPTGGHALAANGDILAAGSLVSDPTVPSSGLAAFAYQSVGIGDPAFGTNGGVSTPFANFPRVSAAGMALEPTGSIVEIGTVSSTTQGAFGLVRYTAQGQLDNTFGSGGTVTTSFGSGTTPIVSAIAIQSNDKIVVAGTVGSFAAHGQFNTSLVVARYLGN